MVAVVEGDVVVAVVCGATVTPLLRTNLPPDLTHVYLLPAITNCFPRVVQGVPASDDLSAETGIATDSQESVSSPISTRFITELYSDIDSSMTANVTEIHRIGGAPGKNRTCDLRFRNLPTEDVPRWLVGITEMNPTSSERSRLEADVAAIVTLGVRSGKLSEPPSRLWAEKVEPTDRERSLLKGLVLV